MFCSIVLKNNRVSENSEYSENSEFSDPKIIIVNLILFL